MLNNYFYSRSAKPNIKTNHREQVHLYPSNSKQIPNTHIHVIHKKPCSCFLHWLKLMGTQRLNHRFQTLSVLRREPCGSTFLSRLCIWYLDGNLSTQPTANLYQQLNLSPFVRHVTSFLDPSAPASLAPLSLQGLQAPAAVPRSVWKREYRAQVLKRQKS